MEQTLVTRPHNTLQASDTPHPLGLALVPLLAPYFLGLDREHLIIVGCDSRQRLMSFVEQRGQTLAVDGVLPALRQAMAPTGVSQLLVAHNHPCGSTNASQADCEVTRRIAALARLAGVTLADHLLFAGSRHTSFRALGLL